MADENDEPPASKLTRSKQRWAREGRFLTGKTSRPEEQRLPPGQHLTRDWPILDLGLTPQISRERWRLDVYGAVEHPLFWDFAQFTAQPQSKFISDIHCVTTWSRYDNQWEGLATRDLLTACRPRDEARHVVLHSHDGYTTNLALDRFRRRGRPARAFMVGHAAGAGAWRPGAAGGAASLFLEKREMAAEHRIPRARCAGLLGSARLSQPRRPVDRAALFR